MENTTSIEMPILPTPTETPRTLHPEACGLSQDEPTPRTPTVVGAAGILGARSDHPVLPTERWRGGVAFLLGQHAGFHGLLRETHGGHAGHVVEEQQRPVDTRAGLTAEPLERG